MPKYYFFPGQDYEKYPRYGVRRVSLRVNEINRGMAVLTRQSVEIDRAVGKAGVWGVTRTAYYNASPSSARRLCKVMQDMTNKGQVSIHLALPHEVEFEF
jgi:hypothetical protein